MKSSKVALIIVAFVAIVSFAFITVNKQQAAEKEIAIEEVSIDNTSMGGGYAMEDENQWN